MKKLSLFLAGFLLVAVLAAGHASAQKVLTVDLAESSVDITTGFTGARLVLFGTRREPGELAIVISGPARTMVVRHKEEVLGIWMNRESVAFSNVPVYYDFALSAPAEEITSPEILRESGIGLNALRFIHTGRENEEVVERFREALVRNKQAQGHFPLEYKKINFLNDSLFRTAFYLPADVPTGQYTIHSYLLRDDVVLDRQETRLRVAQVGFSARLYYFARSRPWTYGLIAVLLPMMAGGLASVALRRK